MALEIVDQKDTERRKGFNFRPNGAYLTLKIAGDFILLPDNETIAAAGRNGPVRLFDVRTGTEKAQVARSAKGLICFTWSSDGKFLAISVKKAMAICRADTGDVVREVPRSKMEFLDWRDEGILSIGGFDERAAGRPIRFSLLDASEPAKETTLAIDRVVTSLHGFNFSQDGKQLALVWSPPDGMPQFGVWSWPDCKPLFQRGANYFGTWSWAADGKSLLLDHTVVDARTGESVWDVTEGASRQGNAIAMSPDGAWIVSGTQQDKQTEITIWRTKDRAKVRSFNAPEPWCFGLAFSPDGSVLGMNCHRKSLFWNFPALLA